MNIHAFFTRMHPRFFGGFAFLLFLFVDCLLIVAAAFWHDAFRAFPSRKARKAQKATRGFPDGGGYSEVVTGVCTS